MSEYDTDRMSEAVVIKCVNCGYPEARWYASYKEGKGWLCSRLRPWLHDLHHA